MPESSEKGKKLSNLESELYLLIAKFLRTGPCRRTAEVLREELEEHKLLPKRIDWLGNEHNRTFNELDSLLSQVTDDHLLRICARIGPILDKEIPPTVPGLISLLGVGHQSLLRTKEDLEKPKYQINNLAARKHGMPLYPSPAVQSTFPPNIAQVLASRELSGAITSRHAFSPKIYARQQPYRRLLGHLSSVYCVLFDRTGKYIFTGADDNLVKVWSALDGRLLASLRGHSAEITDMAVNYENTLLAAGSCDKTIRVWCLHTTAPVAVLNGHTGMVTSLQFCPYPKNKEQLLISTGNDGCICFWQWNPQTNVFNPKPLKFTERNKAGAQMICSSFSPGGLFLATGSTDHSVRVYNIAGLNGPEKILERESHVDRVDSLQFSNLDCRFVSGSKDGTAFIWKYEKRSWSSIQLKMTTKLPSEVSNEAEDSKLKLRVTMVGWTLDDSKVVTAVSDYSIKVWNSYNGTLCHILKGHEDEVFVLEAHPTDSRIFLSSGHDGRIILWDLVSGSIVKNHFNLIEGQGHGAVFDCKFSPDGLMFASTDSHGHLCIFGYGSNERYKKVPEEQFFHTDYRPLIRDINHHVLDEQTQTAPHLLPPPFLVDIDGNPYPPNLQRLVPGREQCNDSQLIPYVAVFAEGESEILQPVRPANDGSSDRPTIDDMIERLQQEQQNQNQVNRGSSENSAGTSSSDSFRQSRTNRRLQSSSDDRNAQEPFSPRTPRSQAGHSRVGLRRTGDVEGVQSVGNWQSRVNQGELPAWVKRIVVKPVTSTLSKSFFQKRMCLADYELSFFNRELKRRAPDPKIEYNSEERNNRRVQRQSIRNSARLRNRDENFNNLYGEEFENPERMNLNTSTDTESEQEEESPEESSDDSGSEYSDWIQDVKLNKAKPSTSGSKPSTSIKPTKSRSTRQTQPNRYSDSSDDEQSDAENGEEEEEEDDDDEEESSEELETPKRLSRKVVTQKKKTKMVNGKKINERFRPPEWLTDVMPHKAPYVPQIGDEIVYFRQGHELYVQAVKRNRIYDIYMRSQPWRKINLRDQEVARIEDITFENHPPRLCCLKLVLLNPASKQADTFTVKYHDMADVIDFIVLKQNYDHAMFYDWKPGDRFRSAIDKAWWLGTIKSQKPLNPNFPDSMFQCFLVKWDNGEKEHMSPWDFEPIDNDRLPDEEGGSVEIMPEERQAMMYVPEPHEWSTFGRDHDCDRIARGLTRIMELNISEPFVTPVDLNLYPSYAIVIEYPMDLGTIKARVQNRFYRRLEAIKFDVRYIYFNARSFNEPGSRIVKQAKCVVDLCVRFIESSHCADPMVIYHEMMEAKQSRSQDSQSELDVLCSESDSDGYKNTSKRLKRKKQNAMQQSSKRVRLGSQQKYTSDSWKQQCSSLLDSIFQWDDSTPFRYPVNLNEYPDYRNIIDCPMDLSTVREKLNNNHYSSPTDFCKDMRLIFQNSRNYNTNKRSRIYSMTIRLSAMFEEHIRGIVSDWRSAVKYEEKIRNNQYVSNRRRPIPVQETGVNVGASTSRAFSASLPSTSRGESSRHSLNKILNAAYSDSPKSSHSSKLANGSGPKKVIKSERIALMKSAAHIKKKHINRSAGSSLTNGVTKKQILRASKRKLHEKTSKRHVQNISKREPSNTEGSRSDSNASNQSSSPGTDDNEWGRTVKKLRYTCNKDNNSKFHKRLRPRNLPKHKKLSSSPMLSRYTRRLRLRSRSSSPENRVVNVKKSPEKTTLSPLHTRSQRHLRDRAPYIHHCVRNSTLKPQKYQTSGDGSESDESVVHNRRSARISNSSSSSNISNRIRSSRRQISTKNQVESQSNESGESSDHEEEKPRFTTRATATRDKLKACRALKGAPKKESPRIETRNRGQRTVRYEEDSDDEMDMYKNSDSENTEPMFSFSSRGRLQNSSNEAKDCDSIEENVYNGETSLSETEVHYSEDSSTESDSETECESMGNESSIAFRTRLRPRKRTKYNVTSSLQSMSFTDNSSSVSSFKGSSRKGKYKNKCQNSGEVPLNYRKAMMCKVVLPIRCDATTSTTATATTATATTTSTPKISEETVVNCRRRSRKSKAKRYNFRTANFKETDESTIDDITSTTTAAATTTTTTTSTASSSKVSEETVVNGRRRSRKSKAKRYNFRTANFKETDESTIDDITSTTTAAATTTTTTSTASSSKVSEETVVNGRRRSRKNKAKRYDFRTANFKETDESTIDDITSTTTAATTTTTTTSTASSPKVSEETVVNGRRRSRKNKAKRYNFRTANFKETDESTIDDITSTTIAATTTTTTTSTASSPKISEETVVNGRRRSRKNKAKRYNFRTANFKETDESSHLAYQNSFYSRAYSSQTRFSSFSTFANNSAQTKTRYRRMSLKKLGLNYKRKAMLCKIVLPILTVKNRYAPHTSKRGRWRTKGNSLPKNKWNRRKNSPSRRRWRTKRGSPVRGRGTSRHSTKRNENGNNSRKGSRVKPTKSSILRSELLRHQSSNPASTSLEKSSADCDLTNSFSQASTVQSNYNLKERKSRMSYSESSNDRSRWNIKSPDSQIQTRYKGEKTVTYTERDSDFDSTENNEEDDSDTLSYSSESFESTSILNVTEETETSSDTLSVSTVYTQGSREATESNFSHLQSIDPSSDDNGNVRQTNSVYENIDVFCNNAIMFGDKSNI